MEIQERVPLGPLTTLGVGGSARWFAEAADEDEVREAVRWAGERGVPLLVLGGGSNLLVSDEGFDGMVLRMMLRGIEIEDVSSEQERGRVFRVAAGEDWDHFVSRTVAEGCAGVECLAGIPGTVGGTPVQNVGAYGQEVAETIASVRVLDRENLEFREMTAAECGFAYRTSVFNTICRGRYVVTRVDFRLRPGGAPSLRYADLIKEFPVDASPTLAEVAETVRRIRRRKGMLLVDGDPDSRSAGSFFKNPIIAGDELSRLRGESGLAIPSYPAAAGFVKLPAAWLIEQAGFHKGFGREFGSGRAAISSRHSLALVNLGGAEAKDVLALRDVIAAGVRDKFGINLEMEPVTVGLAESYAPHSPAKGE